MDNQKEISWELAIKLLEEGKIKQFSKFLYKLFSDLTCGCIFSNYDKNIYEKLLELINRIEDDPSDFDLNLIKGFINLRNDNEEEGYVYLSNAIKINNTMDLPYSLRAFIEPKINPDYKEDAKNAVSLNPSSRNFFVLGTCLDNDKDSTEVKIAITNYSDAIKLRPDFACAYNNRAIKFEALKDFGNAISDYKKCIEIDQSHWAYSALWNLLYKEKRYSEALDYAEQGAINHLNDKKYQFRLAITFMGMDNYETALNHYQIYLKDYFENQTNKSNYHVSRSHLIVDRYIIEKYKQYFGDDYDQDNIPLGDYLVDFEDYYFHDLEIYLFSLLKNKDKDKLLFKKNEIFKRLDKLMNSYNEKIDKGRKVLKMEENVNNLMAYWPSSKIGFGKYNGQIVNDIIEEDPDYVLWCIINLEHFSIINSLFLDKRLKSESKYLTALEYNLMKSLITQKWMPEEDEYEDMTDDYIDALNKDMEGDWGGLYGEEAETGYWNTQ